MLHNQLILARVEKLLYDFKVPKQHQVIRVRITQTNILAKKGIAIEWYLSEEHYRMAQEFIVVCADSLESLCFQLEQFLKDFQKRFSAYPDWQLLCKESSLRKSTSTSLLQTDAA